MDRESRSGGLTADVRELVELLRNYAKQETVGPLKGLGRYIGFGLLGAVLMSFAVVLLVLAGMRALQSETTAFHGNWSWVPYALAVVALAIIASLSVMAIAREGGRGSQ